jgi:hypothetical protein
MSISIRYLVSSHVAYSAVTVPRALRALTRASGISPDRILVVCGGAAASERACIGGVEHRFVTHNSYDHTGLIELLDSGDRSEYWFALHDTCETGPEFEERSRKVDARHEYTSAVREGWFNMGAFSWSFLQREADYVLSLRNCTKVQAILTERNYMRLAESAWYGTGEIEYRGFEDVYGRGVRRSRLYLPDLDMYKFQANWQGYTAIPINCP